MATTSVNEGSGQRNQDRDYGSMSRNGVHFRKLEEIGMKSEEFENDDKRNVNQEYCTMKNKNRRLYISAASW